MLSKVMWFLILLISTALAALSTAPSSPPPPAAASSGQPSSSQPPPTPSYAYKTAPPVFTADNARHTTQAPPPTATHAHARTRHAHAHKQPNYYDVDAGIDVNSGPTITSVENTFNNEVPYIEHRALQDEDGEKANAGFVAPVDFSSILSELDKVSGGKDAREVLRNPFATETRRKNRDRDGFPYFFNGAESNDNVFEPNFGSLASSASDQKTRKVKEDEEEGFVDPNVQFRSLFESTETADGFRPSDFLDYQGDTSGADLSKGSQSRAYPQFTYTGRDGDGSDGDEEEDDVYKELSNPRYRSSYRQVDSRNRNRERERDPYDDSNYYSGERDRSPAAPAPPPPKYKVGGGGGGKAVAATEETAHSQPSSGSGSKGESPGKNKCKKVEKLVEENEEYDSFLEPEEGYDPSTYTSRYKRQAGGRQARAKGNKKRPMTCYVCEDEEGRYAERCSYDSKADPKQGSYFHSSSTSFNDNGKRGGRGGRGGGGGGGDRYKRDPEHSAPAPGTLEAQASSDFRFRDNDEDSNGTDSSSEEVELPKKLQKRQSSGGRYASGYPRQGERQRQQQGEGNRRQQEYEDADEEDYESPYAPYGTDSGREEYGFSPPAPGRRNNDRTRGRNEFDIRIPRPDYGADPGNANGDRAREEDYDEDFDYGPPSPSPSGRGGNRNRGSSSSGGGRGRSNSPESDFDLGPGPSYGGGPSGGNRRAGGGRGNGSGRGQQEFGFGAPPDFGRDQGEDSRGFAVDFSIPKEFDPDVQLGASNSNNRPIFSNNDFGPEFDNAYEEHVKRYFPEAFGSSGSSSTPGPGERGHSPPHPSSTYRPDGPGPGPAPYSSPRPGPPAPVYRGRSPTQQRHRYSPPPYFNGPEHYGPPGGHEDDVAHSNGHLHQAINSFQQKGNRQGCQRVQKGDMSCIVCSDPRGMKKEECMYASNDPKNHQMAYHEVSEYSSLPPASILPHPKSGSGSKTGNGNKNQHVESSRIVHQESRRVEVKKLPKPKSEPIDYDFDY